MFANLLPGVRELRAPLAAGYLWLLFAWLILPIERPTAKAAKQDTGTLGRLYELEPLVGPIGLAVVVSIAAYLLGSLTLGLAPWWRRMGLRQRRAEAAAERSGEPAPPARWPWTRSYWRNRLRTIENELWRKYTGRLASARMSPLQGLKLWLVSSRVTPSGRDRLMTWADRRYRDLGDDPQVQEGGDPDVGHLFISAVNGFEEVKTKLTATNELLYSEVDRRENEGTFRAALVPPLLALLVYLMFTESHLWVAGIIPALLLWVQGRRLRAEAGELLADALLAHDDLEPFALREMRDQRKRKIERLEREERDGERARALIDGRK
jgi:hypothetical protein